MDPAAADADLDLVALATVADCVPLVDENRRLVREGLRALASTRKPGLQALMEVARVDPSGVDAGAIGFRLAPRINAAGRLHRADAGLELLLTSDVERARAIAEELDRVNVERRDVETRILFEAEAQVAAARAGGAEPAAYVLAADGWHPGVIGIVASRIAERHHRPAVLIALDGEEGTGSGRSIPAFDLLGGLDACADELLRARRPPRGRGADDRARPRRRVPRRVRGARRRALTPEDLIPRRAGRRGRPRRRPSARARGGARAARAVRDGQPGAVRCSCRARCWPIRGRWARGATSRSRSRRAAPARAACPSAAAARCRPAPASRSTPRSGSRSIATTAPSSRGSSCATRSRRGRRRSRWSASSPLADAIRAELARDPDAWGDERGGPGGRVVRDARDGGIAGLIGDLVAAGEPVLAVAAHARQRAARARRPRRRLLAHDLVGARGRPRPRGAVRARRRGRPARPRTPAGAGRVAARRRLDPPRLGRPGSASWPAPSSPGSSTCARSSPSSTGRCAARRSAPASRCSPRCGAPRRSRARAR